MSAYRRVSLHLFIFFILIASARFLFIIVIAAALFATLVTCIVTVSGRN